jgi:hypothetical protein
VTTTFRVEEGEEVDAGEGVVVLHTLTLEGEGEVGVGGSTILRQV